MVLSVFVDDITMVCKNASLVPTWARERKEIELEDPIPLVDQVFLGCTLRTDTVDEETIRTKTEMLPTNTTSSMEQIY